MTNKSSHVISPVLSQKISSGFYKLFPVSLRKYSPVLVKKELEYILCISRYRKMLKNYDSIKSLLIIIDINEGDKEIFIQCSKVLRYYFPDSRIDFICNGKAEYLNSLPAIKYHDNIFNVYYGKGILTFDDYEKTSEVVSKIKYSAILNLSPYFERESFQKLPDFIQLYVPFYVYLSFQLSLNRNKVKKSAALHSFLHHYFAPIMLEKEYTKQVKRELLLRIQNS